MYPCRRTFTFVLSKQYEFLAILISYVLIKVLQHKHSDRPKGYQQSTSAGSSKALPTSCMFIVETWDNQIVGKNDVGISRQFPLWLPTSSRLRTLLYIITDVLQHLICLPLQYPIIPIVPCRCSGRNTSRSSYSLFCIDILNPTPL